MLSERKSAALTDLLTRMCDGNVDQQQWEALESLLLGDPNAQDFYWEFMVVNVNLEWHAASQPSCLPILPAATEGPESAGEELTGSPSAGVSPGGARRRFFRPSPFLLLPLWQSLAGSAVFSYLAAAVLLGGGPVGRRLEDRRRLLTPYSGRRRGREGDRLGARARREDHEG